MIVEHVHHLGPLPAFLAVAALILGWVAVILRLISSSHFRKPG